MSDAAKTLSLAAMGLALSLVAILFYWSAGSTGSFWYLAPFAVLALLGGAIAFGAAIMFAAKIGQIGNVRRVYRAILPFFTSGNFYIVVGSLFLWAAFSKADDAHSALIFILVILGVAIVLYGTGTQAAGTGSAQAPTNDQIKANIAIAGGAGVLAAVFGFGIISYKDGLVGVFKRTIDYGVIELYLDTNNTTSATTKFDRYEVAAHLPGSRPLPLWKNESSIQIFVPILNLNTVSDVNVVLRPKPDLARRDQEATISIPSIAVTWKDVGVQYGLNNEVVRLKPYPIQATLVAAQVDRSIEPERREGVAQVTEENLKKLQSLQFSLQPQ
jgi:hypothetical protein